MTYVQADLALHFLCRQLQNMNYPFTMLKQSLALANLAEKPFGNIVGKEENAGNQHFLLNPQCFLLYQRQIPVCHRSKFRQG